MNDAPEVYDRLNRIDTEQAVLRRDVGTLVSKIDTLATAVDGIKNQRQFSLPVTLAFCGALIALLTFGNQSIDNRISAAVKDGVSPFAALDARSEAERQRLFASAERNADAIAGIAANVRGLEETLVEIETQFKWTGNMINHNDMDRRLADCRYHPAECSALQFHPVFSRGAKGE